MSKQTLLANRPKQWAKDKSDLDESRNGFWDHIQTISRICESATYLEEFKTVEDFLKHEGFAKSQYYELRQAGQSRVSLSGITDSEIPVSQLITLSKVDEKTRKKIYAEESEAAEAKGEKLTNAKLKKAVKAASNGRPDEPEEIYEDVEDEPEPPKEPEWRKLKAKAIATGEALQRAIDDLHESRASTSASKKAHEHCWTTIETIRKGWK